MFRFLDGSIVTSYSILRFRSRDETVASLLETGFIVDDVRDATDRPGRELIFVARRSSLLPRRRAILSG